MFINLDVSIDFILPSLNLLDIFCDIDKTERYKKRAPAKMGNSAMPFLTPVIIRVTPNKTKTLFTKRQNKFIKDIGNPNIKFLTRSKKDIIWAAELKETVYKMKKEK